MSIIGIFFLEVEITSRLALERVSALVGKELQVALLTLLCDVLEGGENDQDLLAL